MSIDYVDDYFWLLLIVLPAKGKTRQTHGKRGLKKELLIKLEMRFAIFHVKIGDVDD